MRQFIVVVAFLALDMALSQNCPPVPTCKTEEMLCTQDVPVPPAPVCPTDTAPITPCPVHSCHPMTETKPNGVICQKSCPNVCGANEMHCHGGYDSNGCEKTGYCMYTPPCGPAPTCPPSEFTPEGCPVEPTCSQDEQLCAGPPSTTVPGTTDVPSCLPLGTCIPNFHDMARDKFGNPCPRYCPQNCEGTQMQTCSGHYEANGCPAADKCVPLTEQCPAAEFNARGCRIHYPMECRAGEKVCPVGADDQGCHLGFTKIPATEKCPEVQLPPPE